MCRLLIILTLINVCVCDQLVPTCNAGVVFLKSTASPVTNNDLIYAGNNTYVIHITYPCDQDVMEKIKHLQTRVNDPFVSFYLKKNRNNRVKRNNRANLIEYGSGDFDENDDEDDDEEDEEEEEDDDHVNEIEEITSIEPSFHIVIPQPTPSGSRVFGILDHTIEFDLPVSPIYTPEIASFSINPTRTFTPTSSVEDLFQNLGSGDGPNLLSTPSFSPPIITTDTTYTPVRSYGTNPTPPLGYVRQNLPKQLVHEGLLHKLTIPEHTFEPACTEYKIQTNEPWVDLNNRTVRFFPVQNHTSEWVFPLLCVSNGATTNLTVSVRQRQKSRLYNHAFKLEFGMVRDSTYSRVELLEKLVHEISSSLNSVKNESLIILSHGLESYPYTLSYVNESIISNVCPVHEMKIIYELLSNIKSFIHMDHVSIVIPVNNQCNPSVITQITGNTDTRGKVVADNFPPSIKNQIDKINGSVGEYLVHDVKHDFCYDPEDGETRNLHLSLSTNELTAVPESHWLQFDSKNQEFYGLPMNAIEQEFVLTCADKNGKQANDVLVLSITPGVLTPKSYNSEFSVHFQSIPFTPKAIRKFIEKLSSILSPHIHVIEYAESNGHVLFKWFNTTNPSTEHEVTSIRKVMLSDDGPVNKRFYNAFTPEFNITVASVIPTKNMLSENNPNDVVGSTDTRYFDFENPTHEHDHTRTSDERSKVIDGIATVDNYSGYLTTYIIPSVLIAIMILLALIIACLLSRKNKYTQASTEDDSPNARVYLKNAKKGVPIILENEYDEKLFGNEHNRGNIYEPQLPRSGTNTPRTGGVPMDNCSSGMNSPRVTSPNPLPRNFTPLPPDYTSSINRNVLRNRPPPHMMMHGTGVVAGAPHAPHHPPPPQTQQYASPPQYELRERQMDSYAPPAPISYYGIHTSNSGTNYASYAGPGGHGKSSLPPPYVPP